MDAVERLIGRPLGSKDTLRERFADLAEKFKIPERSVIRFLEEKTEKRRLTDRAIRSPGALYGFAQEDLPGWIAKHSREIENARKADDRSVQPQGSHLSLKDNESLYPVVPLEERLQRREEELRELRTKDPDSPRTLYLPKEIAELRKELEAHRAEQPQAKRAGASV